MATPKNDQRYDDSYLKQAIDDLNHLQIFFQTRGVSIADTDVSEVECAVAKLNNNKAADYMGLTAEHLKYGGVAIYPVLVRLINTIFKQNQIPHSLKKGVITPVHKKGSLQNPDNYRGITVTSILLKVVEHILNARHRPVFMTTQSRL